LKRFSRNSKRVIKFLFALSILNFLYFGRNLRQYEQNFLRSYEKGRHFSFHKDFREAKILIDFQRRTEVWINKDRNMWRNVESTSRK